jgi:uncharacterized short protein YbdD (DUF466 family)
VTPRVTLLRFLASLPRAAWRYLRAVSGDSAYDIYRARALRGRSLPPLTREQFYLDELRRRYTGITRCC